jgi:hypothetical protein
MDHKGYEKSNDEKLASNILPLGFESQRLDGGGLRWGCRCMSPLTPALSRQGRGIKVIFSS